MKHLWDFIFGVLLIGGAPWSVMAFVILVGDLVQKYVHVDFMGTVGFVVFGIMAITAFLAFGAAVAYRVKKRVLPRGFIIAEVLIGVIGAILLFGVYGVFMHSTID